MCLFVTRFRPNPYLFLFALSNLLSLIAASYHRCHPRLIGLLLVKNGLLLAVLLKRLFL